jgi:hypothetical protein
VIGSPFLITIGTSTISKDSQFTPTIASTTARRAKMNATTESSLSFAIKIG